MCIQKAGGTIATSAATRTRTKEIPTLTCGNMKNQKMDGMNVISVGKK